MYIKYYPPEYHIYRLISHRTKKMLKKVEQCFIGKFTS